MNMLFIWENLNNVSNNYHPEGGLVVIAEDLETAKRLATEQGVVFDESSTLSLSASTDASQGVFIFPNAGCC